MPVAFFAATSTGGIYTHLCHMHFFTEIHGSFNTFQYSAWEMFSCREWACSELPLLPTWCPAVCSGLLISLSYSRVRSTKAEDSQPRGAFVLPRPSSPLARSGSVGLRQPRASTARFPALPPNAFLKVGVLPQQLSNSTSYAASNLPTSLNMPRLRHVSQLPCRADPGPLTTQQSLPSLGIHHIYILFILFPPHFKILVSCPLML